MIWNAKGVGYLEPNMAHSEPYSIDTAQAEPYSGKPDFMRS